MKFTKQALGSMMSILALVLLTGCNNQSQSNSSGQTMAQTTAPSTTQTTAPSTSTDPKQQQADVNKDTPAGNNQNSDASLTPAQKAAIPLVSEFRDYVAKINAGDNSKYNYIMSADRLNGIQAINPPGDIRNLLEANMETVNQQLKGTLVYFDYSLNGIHFLALVQPVTMQDDVYKDAVNKIRGDQREFQLLNDILMKTDWRGNGGYYAVDLYAEDLLGHLQEIKVDDITISDTKGMAFDQTTGKVKGQHPIYPKDPQLDKVLQQYGRKLGDSHVLPNKSWNLFVFKGGNVVTPDFDLVIEYGGEHLVLRGSWLGGV